jgi:hypothetical protein
MDGVQPTKTLTATRCVTTGWCGEEAAKAGSGHPTHGSSAVAGGRRWRLDDGDGAAAQAWRPRLDGWERQRQLGAAAKGSRMPPWRPCKARFQGAAAVPFATRWAAGRVSQTTEASTGCTRAGVAVASPASMQAQMAV